MTAAAAAPAQLDDPPSDAMFWTEENFKILGLKIPRLCCARFPDESASDWRSRVQLSIVVHSDQFDTKAIADYITSPQLLAGPASGAGGTVESVLGPYNAILGKVKHDIRCTAVQGIGDKVQQLLAKPHKIILKEQVRPSSGYGLAPPLIRIHVKPGHAISSSSSTGNMVSRAGEGPGRQIYPGTVEEVGKVGEMSATTKSVTIPGPLSCSQLPASLSAYPLDVTLKLVMEQETGDAMAGVLIRVNAGHWKTVITRDMQVQGDSVLERTQLKIPDNCSHLQNSKNSPWRIQSMSLHDHLASDRVLRMVVCSSAFARRIRGGIVVDRVPAWLAAQAAQQHAVQVVSSGQGAVASPAVWAAASVTAAETSAGAGTTTQQATPAATAAAAAPATAGARLAPTAAVIDLTADDSDSENKSRTVAAAATHGGTASTSSSADEAAVAAPMPAPAAAEQQVPASGAGLLCAATSASAAVPAPPAVQLPAGLQLQDVSTPEQMKWEVGRLLQKGLMPLMDSQQYHSLQRQVREAFEKHQQAAVEGSRQLHVLQYQYAFLQGAVRAGSQLAEGVEEIEGLLSAA